MVIELAQSEQEFEKKWLASLNEKQREAVECLEGPLLVLAGAGTGKTRVLTVRLMMLVVKGCAYPSQIMAATFTNKAAREIIGRIESLLGAETHRMALGTFHSLSVKLLRRYAETIGMRRDFTIVDTDDQRRLLKEVLQDLSLEADISATRRWVSMIQRWKDRALKPEAVSDEEAEGRAREVYRLYQRRLLATGACDFGDLILHCVEIFRNNADILRQCREQYRYLLFDEYQDTNVAQYLWMRLLAEGHKNICCVGDDDQSIYGWRGAEVGNILRFEKDFPQARVIRLERNYRSQPHILQAAAGLICRNKQRMGKTLWTEEEGFGAQEKISIRGFYDGRSEARSIVEEIEALHRRHSIGYGQMAVLVRTGTQTRAFEEAFLFEDIPYRVVGGARFYEREEIRDVTAYLRATYQSADDLAFRRIANKPARGLGAITLRKVAVFAQAQGMPMQEAIDKLLEQGIVKGRAAQTLSTLCQQLRDWRKASAEMPLRNLVERIVAQSGYMQYWRDKADEQTRLDNIRELYSALEEVESLESFLEHVALVVDGEEEDGKGRVSVMTMHAAKGLEFDAVFLPGWEEGLFPMQRSLQEKGEQALEEERRLAYVALTRARKYVTIGYAHVRHIFGHMRTAEPSRFLREIPREVVVHDETFVYDSGDADEGWQNPKNSWQESKQDSWQESWTESPTESWTDKSPDSFTPAPQARSDSSGVAKGAGSVLKIGDPCKHRQLGEGRVVGYEKNTLTIAFPNKGVYRIDPDYVVALD